MKQPKSKNVCHENICIIRDTSFGSETRGNIAKDNLSAIIEAEENMGTFDRWRRKKEHNIRSTVRAREIMWTGSRLSEPLKTSMATHSTPVAEGEIKSLLVKRDELTKRREELQQQRAGLTRRLDNGEMSPIDFRKQLMAIIQDAAEVSESLRATTSRVTEIGYQGLVTE